MALKDAWASVEELVMNDLYNGKPCLDHGFKGNARGYASVRRPAPWGKLDGPRNKNPKVLMHRWVFYEAHGYVPPVVMHACDNTRCVEIAHLSPGDWDLNNKDRAQKGRSAPWVPSRQKLTHPQVREIRERFAKRTPRDSENGPFALSKAFGVDINVIYQIATGRTYRDVC